MSRPLRLSEKVEQARIVQLLRTIGATVYVLGHPSPNDGRTHRGTGQTAGIADLEAFLPKPTRAGQTLGFLKIEVKAAGGQLSAPQHWYQSMCQAADVPHLVGGLVVVEAWRRQRGYVK